MHHWVPTISTFGDKAFTHTTGSKGCLRQLRILEIFRSKSAKLPHQTLYISRGKKLSLWFQYVTTGHNAKSTNVETKWYQSRKRSSSSPCCEFQKHTTPAPSTGMSTISLSSYTICLWQHSVCKQHAFEVWNGTNQQTSSSSFRSAAASALVSSEFFACFHTPLKLSWQIYHRQAKWDLAKEHNLWTWSSNLTAFLKSHWTAKGMADLQVGLTSMSLSASEGMSVLLYLNFMYDLLYTPA